MRCRLRRRLRCRLRLRRRCRRGSRRGRGCRRAVFRDDERAGYGAQIIRVGNGGHHRVAAGGRWRGRGTVIGQTDAEARWHRRRRSRLGCAIESGGQITEGDRGGSLADDQRAGSSSSIIFIINDCHNSVTASRSRSRGRTIVGHVDGEACRDRGDRRRLRRGVVGREEVTEINGGRGLINDQRAESASLVSGIIDFGHHEVATRVGRNRGGSVVSEVHFKTRRHGGDRGCPGAAVEGCR